MIKYGSTGWGAQAGVTAALLAHSGYTGDTDVFDGEYGFWRFTGRSEAINEETFADMGDEWLWRKINFKRYPSGGVLSGVLNQFIHLIKTNDIEPGDISKIAAYAPPIVGFTLFKQNELETPDDYCFNARYLLACAAHGIELAYWQREETRRDKRIIDFMGSVDIDVITDERPPKPLEVVANGKHYYGDAAGSRKPELEDGDIFDEMVIGKFKSNASSLLNSQNMDAIIKEVLNLDEVTTIAPVMDLVRS
jgi:2-methylcitrate dehydratase PrpD